MAITERLLLAASSPTLAWRDNATMPVEFVAALSAASDLGSDILRAKGGDQGAWRRAVIAVIGKVIKKSYKARQPLSPAMAQIMAVCALVERIHPHCKTCHGAKVMQTALLKITCPTCGGHGIDRYTDRERAKLCGVGDWEPWQAQYAIVQQIIQAHDTADSDADRRLG